MGCYLRGSLGLYPLVKECGQTQIVLEHSRTCDDPQHYAYRPDIQESYVSESLHVRGVDVLVHVPWCRQTEYGGRIQQLMAAIEDDLHLETCRDTDYELRQLLSISSVVLGGAARSLWLNIQQDLQPVFRNSYTCYYDWGQVKAWVRARARLVCRHCGDEFDLDEDHYLETWLPERGGRKEVGWHCAFDYRNANRPQDDRLFMVVCSLRCHAKMILRCHRMRQASRALYSVRVMLKQARKLVREKRCHE